MYVEWNWVEILEGFFLQITKGVAISEITEIDTIIEVKKSLFYK